MELSNIVALAEIVVFGAEDIKFLHEIDLTTTDKSLFTALLTHRECGFPDNCSPETIERMLIGGDRSRLHSWIRPYGLQLAYQLYSSGKTPDPLIKSKVMSAINSLVFAQTDIRFKENKIVEPRVIFWFEDVDKI